MSSPSRITTFLPSFSSSFFNALARVVFPEPGKPVSHITTPITLHTKRFINALSISHQMFDKLANIFSKSILFYIILLVVSVFAYLFIYSFWIEPNFLIRVKTINLDRRLNYTIAFISDLHVGDYDPQIRYDKLYKILNKTRPNLIIIGGDVLGERDKIERADEILLNLSRIAPILVIPGNWDYYTRFVSEENILTLELKSNERIKFLINDFYITNITNASKICIYGMDWLNPMFKDFNKNCTVRIVVMHSPGFYKYIPNLKEKHIDLILAGHTHGGQVNIFGFVPYVPDHLGKEGLIYGLVKKEGVPIYITSGIGVHRLFPFRFNVPPEVVIIKI